MKKYKSIKEDLIFIPQEQEINSLSKLNNPQIAINLWNFIQENPYPLDHEMIHKFAEGMGMKAEDLEVYAYAMLSCFVAGGKSYKAGRTNKKSFDLKECLLGRVVEMEHVDTWTDNEVVRAIAKLIAEKIQRDHNADREDYYTYGMSFNFFDELMKK